MFPKAIRFVGRLMLFSILSVLTQVGGIVYLIARLLFRKRSQGIRVLGFTGLYIVTCFLIVPILAKVLGREKIDHSAYVRPVSYLTVLCNRNYVDPEWNDILMEVSTEFGQMYPGIQVRYLDANFPFFNGFPLLPHLSHDDGEKLDLAFIYRSEDGLTNKKPSWSGYGRFENPKSGEVDTNARCKASGYWQYDLAKFIGWGFGQKPSLAEKETAQLIRLFLEQSQVKKIFIEPHLKTRMGIQNSKVRFHGCHAVRHDDHIHLEL